MISGSSLYYTVAHATIKTRGIQILHEAPGPRRGEEGVTTLKRAGQIEADSASEHTHMRTHNSIQSA